MWEKIQARFSGSLLDPVYFWETLGTYEDEPIVFDRWQRVHMRDFSRVRFREKAPQIGFSWTCAAEAVWEAMLFEDSMTGFISVDQREAQNKILYARKLYDGLPYALQALVPIVRDAMEAIDFGTIERPSQLLSLPATAGMRGRRMNVVLDESDFYKDGGMSAYRAGIGRITRGGRMSVGSTCWGVDTILDRMMKGEDAQGEHLDEADVVSTGRFPHVVAEKPIVLEGIEMARKTLDRDDFDEEYNCIRSSGLSDPFSSKLMRECQHTLDLAPDEDGTNSIIEIKPEGGMIRVYPAEEEGKFCAGYDIAKGTGRHPSFLSLAQKIGGQWKQIALMQPKTSGKSELSLPQQLEWLIELMTRLPHLRLVPDGQGLGAHIAQELEHRFGKRRVLVMLPGSKPKGLKSQDKTEMITETRRVLEAGDLQLMPDIEQIKQFSRTKKGPGGQYVQRGSSRRDHFDRFWATCYLVYGLAAGGSLDSVYRRRGLSVVGMEVA